MVKKINYSEEERKKRGDRIRKLNESRRGKIYEEFFGQERVDKYLKSISKLKKGIRFTEEHKRKLAISKMGDSNPSKREDVKQKIKETKKVMHKFGFYNHRMKNPIIAKERGAKLKGIKFTEETKQKMKEAWIKEEQRNTRVYGMLKKKRGIMSNPEIKMLEIIERNNLPFNFVGDGKIIIDGYCPDFMSKNPKRIIEVYGWYHCYKESFERDRKRLIAYSLLGYQTLIIYWWELNNEQKVVNKINEFIK
jgi:very-short-patch-repair endonuclease